MSPFVFIDTDILLNFYQIPNKEDILISKIIELVQKKTIKLVTTEQVIDEFNRRREKVIHNATANKQDQQGYGLKIVLPKYFEHLEGYELLRKAVNDTNTRVDKFHKKILVETKKQNLTIDDKIEQLFKSSKIYKVSKSIVDLAHQRALRGNPPFGSKDKSIGDRINWECLLKNVPSKIDLIIISNNSADFCSELDPFSLHSFLRKEWDKRKDSKIIYHKMLSGLVNEIADKQLPIEVLSEEEKGLSSLAPEKQINANKINDWVASPMGANTFTTPNSIDATSQFGKISNPSFAMDFSDQYHNTTFGSHFDTIDSHTKGIDVGSRVSPNPWVSVDELNSLGTNSWTNPDPFVKGSFADVSPNHYWATLPESSALNHGSIRTGYDNKKPEKKP